MSNDGFKNGKAFLGKFFSVILIPCIVYYCVKKPQEEDEKEMIKNMNFEPAFKKYDPFEEQRKKFYQSILDKRDSLREKRFVE